VHVISLFIIKDKFQTVWVYDIAFIVENHLICFRRIGWHSIGSIPGYKYCEGPC
jgi:hypothetical protein